MKNSAADKAKEIVQDPIYLRNRSGFSVQVSLHGGQVLSWKTDRGEELLFISSKATPTAVRGGIQTCFPQFGKEGSLVQHGFARNRMWVTEPPPLDSNDSNDKSYIDLLLKSSASDLKFWPHEFEFRLRVDLALDGSLSLTSRIKNISSKRFSFYIAHHNYFSVSDISDVRVQGLETLYYIDNLQDRKRLTEEGSVSFDSKVDRVYLSSEDKKKIQVLVHDPNNRRTFAIKKERLPDVVVWNPWKEKSKATAALAPEEYMHMVCVGAAAIEEDITLKPGEEWTGKLELSFTRRS